MQLDLIRQVIFKHFENGRTKQVVSRNAAS